MSHGWHVQFQRALKLNVGRLMNFEDTNYTALCQIVEHPMSRDITWLFPCCDVSRDIMWLSPYCVWCVTWRHVTIPVLWCVTWRHVTIPVLWCVMWHHVTIPVLWCVMWRHVTIPVLCISVARRAQDSDRGVHNGGRRRGGQLAGQAWKWVFDIQMYSAVCPMEYLQYCSASNSYIPSWGAFVSGFTQCNYCPSLPPQCVTI